MAKKNNIIAERLKQAKAVGKALKPSPKVVEAVSDKDKELIEVEDEKDKVAIDGNEIINQMYMLRALSSIYTEVFMRMDEKVRNRFRFPKNSNMGQLQTHLKWIEYHQNGMFDILKEAMNLDGLLYAEQCHYNVLVELLTKGMECDLDGKPDKSAKAVIIPAELMGAFNAWWSSTQTLSKVERWNGEVQEFKDKRAKEQGNN